MRLTGMRLIGRFYRTGCGATLTSLFWFGRAIAKGQKFQIWIEIARHFLPLRLISPGRPGGMEDDFRIDLRIIEFRTGWSRPGTQHFTVQRGMNRVHREFLEDGRLAQVRRYRCKLLRHLE